MSSYSLKPNLLAIIMGNGSTHVLCHVYWLQAGPRSSKSTNNLVGTPHAAVMLAIRGPVFYIMKKTAKNHHLSLHLRLDCEILMFVCAIAFCWFTYTL